MKAAVRASAMFVAGVLATATCACGGTPSYGAAVPAKPPPDPIVAIQRFGGPDGGAIPGVTDNAADAAAFERIDTLLHAGQPVPGVAQEGATAPGALAKQPSVGPVMDSGWVLVFGGGDRLGVSATVDRCYPNAQPAQPDSLWCIEDARYASVNGGVVHAPGLVRELSSLVAAWPGLAVAPNSVRAGSRLQVTAVGLSQPGGTSTVVIRPLQGTGGRIVTLGTAKVSARRFRWSGIVPKDLPPGQYFVDAEDSWVGAEVTVEAPRR